jgi:signal transduction histidine kinase
VTLEDLRSIDLFSGLPAEALERLAAASRERDYEPGEWLFQKGDRADDLFVLLDGRMESLSTQDDRLVPQMTHEAGGFIGAISVLTGDPFPGGTRAVVPSRVGLVPRQALREVMHADEEIERRLFRVFAPVYQRVGAQSAQREKMAALGQMAAGLAHELNNPAAAARRSAEELADAMDAIHATLRSFVESGVERADAARFAQLQENAIEQAAALEPLDQLDAADREDELIDWLERRDVPGPWRLAPTLAAAGVDTAWLDAAADAAGVALPAALNSLTAILTARGLAEELTESTERMSRLVGALKEYTYMDQAPQQDVDVHRGLDNTLTILGHKLKPTEIRVVREYADDLPPVPGSGSELNQVWTNLLDNAIAALGESGTITVTTSRENDAVTVTIADDGPGIPDDEQDRVFEPFFTTKGPGEGTGLGLETTYRIVVERHHGNVAVESQPGETRFTVRLPLHG